MYHYVRNNEEYIYDTFCRRKNEFEAQVNYLRKYGEIINPGDIEKVNYHLKNTDRNAFLLSFDDGYKDHYYASKFLHSENLSGIFFPSIKSINGELLDINYIHILLGNRKINPKEILELIKQKCKKRSLRLTNSNKIPVEIDQYIDSFKENTLFDQKLNTLIKRILQRDIINKVERELMCKNIFLELTDLETQNEASKLYLSEDEMLEMKRLGMFFGSHGLNHNWLGYSNYELQLNEIKESLYYLKKINLILDSDLIYLCYPYGSYNKETLKIAKELNIDYCFTTKVGSALVNKENSVFELKRWDTNHFWDNVFRRPCIPIIN